MARFNWKAAIESLAIQVEGALMAQRMFPESATLAQEIQSKSEYAAWVARAYRRTRRTGATK